MVQAEKIDSRCSSFQLDDRSRRDHDSFAHRSKFPLSGAGTSIHLRFQSLGSHLSGFLFDHGMVCRAFYRVRLFRRTASIPYLAP
jgi:hypothetical protein